MRFYQLGTQIFQFFQSLFRSLPSVKMTTTRAQTKEMWRTADAVCFDVDSTVIQNEGIDELAAFVGAGDKVSELTKKAMGGGMTFREALSIRLKIIRPSINQLTDFINHRPPALTPGISTLVSLLHQRGVDVYLISGGFRELIEPVAKILNIPNDNLFCNRIKFYYDGDYAGFDEHQPTSESGGKGRVINLLKSKYDYKKLVMIGDGATDMEASPPADAFIGFGGNVQRPAVKKGAPWFIENFQELINELDGTAEDNSDDMES
ncbi:unnamed protein product [Owenia fusiformis]|uniref:Phosphoserine phosphatase n=1 Tax=Owenia fusiformis TaxID=6347 RepID=A0A8J1TM92_OWEFU|nr:unnamed protein product [Owenia fusiformis]